MDRRIRHVVELLGERWRDDVRVGDLAQRVGLGESRLQHLFKAQAKTTIRDFVRERRLTEAAAMLASGFERISVIGAAVGFPDPSNFNHAFKKRFGIAPREYREREREDDSSRTDQPTTDFTK